MGAFSGWFFNESSGVSLPQIDFWPTRIPFTGQTILITIKSQAGIIPARGDLASPPTTVMSPLNPWTGTSTSGSPIGGFSTANPTGVVTALDGVTTNYSAPANRADVFGLDTFNQMVRGISATTGQITLIDYQFLDGPFDLSSKRFVVHPLIEAAEFNNTIGTLDELGFVIGLKSGTNEYRHWDAGARDTEHTLRIGNSIVIDADNTSYTINSDYNIFDSTDVTGITFGAHNSTGSQTNFLIHQVHILNTVTLIGGSSARPAKMFDFKDITDSSSVKTIKALGSSQISSQQDLQIGNGGTNSIHLVDSAGATSFPATVSGKDVSFQDASETIGLTIYGGASDTIKLTNYTLTGGSIWNFIIHASHSASCTTDFNGLSVINADLSGLRDSIDWTGTNFVGCKQKDITSTDVSGSTFGGSLDSTGAVKIDFNSIAALNTAWGNLPANIQNNAVGVLLNYTGASNLTGTTDDLPSGVIASGNTVDIRIADGGHDVALTIGAPSGSGWSTHDTTGGGTSSITFVLPTLTQVIESDVTATIRYFEDDSQTVVDSTTGTSLDYEYPDTDPIDVEIVAQGYVPFNRQKLTPSNSTFSVEMDFDESYNASHGLTITTEFDYNRATKALTINSDQSALDVRSALADVIRTNSSYYNTKLLMEAIPGLTRIDLINGATITSMATWKGAGMERFDAADSVNPVEKWFAVKSVGAVTGATVHYRQTNSGSSTAVTLTSNVVNEAFQYYRDDNHDGDTSDTNEYDRSDYMVIKSFLAGSKQGRVDVLANAGVSNLMSNLYTVPLANSDHDYAGTDPGISADLTLVAGGTVGGKTFAYEIVDGGTNTGANIAAQLNYNAANDPTATIPGGTGLTWFDLPDMVIHNATAVETERGYREGSTPTLVGFYVSRGGSDHPDFTRFQADDGTYYVPAVVNQATITNLPTAGAEIRLQIYNTTSATEIYNDDPSSATYSDTYTEGGDYSEDDEIRIRFAELNGSTSFKYFETTVTAGSTGWSLNATNFLTTDSVYATNAVDGSAVTKFTYSAADDHFNLVVTSNWTASELFAFYCMTLTTSAGIEGAFGAFTAIDAGNYRNNTSIASIYLDNETTATQRQTDSARVYRDDEAYPVLDPTTSGFGIDVNWKNVVYVVSTGGSALTGPESAHLLSLPTATQVVDEFETQSQADPSGFHVNAMRIFNAEMTGTGVDGDEIRKAGELP